ncbi:MAG: DUF4375 domain-containing protein [Vicinamibacteria bacterium]
MTIYDGPEEFLRQYERTPEAARTLLAAHWCQSEVCNGGFHQLFSNPTGVLAPEAAAGFQAIGLVNLAEVVRHAMDFFESGYPRDQEVRGAVLDEYAERNGEAWDPFEALNDRFFGLVAKEQGGWEVAADAYAARHGA